MGLKFTPPQGVEHEYALFVYDTADSYYEDNKALSVEMNRSKAKDFYATPAIYTKGTLRTYSDLGHAKNGFYHHAHQGYARHNRGTSYAARILKRIDGEWYTLYDIPFGTTMDRPPWYKEVVDYQSVDGTYQDVISYRAKQMSNEEYADWRLAVDHEQKRKPNVKAGLEYIEMRYGGTPLNERVQGYLHGFLPRPYATQSENIEAAVEYTRGNYGVDAAKVVGDTLRERQRAQKLAGSQLTI